MLEEVLLLLAVEEEPLIAKRDGPRAGTSVEAIDEAPSLITTRKRRDFLNQHNTRTRQS
jgi:hypothetical protein